MAKPVAVAPAPLMALELTVATQNCNSLNLTTNIRSYELKIAAIKILTRTSYLYATHDKSVIKV